MRSPYLLLLVPLCILSLAGCTQDSVVKNTALRYVVVQFDAELNKNPDPLVIQEIKKNTKMEVTEVSYPAANQADVTVTIQSVDPADRKLVTKKAVPLHLVKGSAWSVTEANK